ncbi:MAG: M28 family peptidase [Vicinamibacteria bacterium]
MIFLALLAAASLDAATLVQDSATLQALGPHPFGSPRNQAAAQFVAAKLKDAGLAQTVVEDFVFDGAPGTNVYASIQGRTDRLLILATHHDTSKSRDDMSSRSRSLALLIEIARQTAALRPQKTWILASFDGGDSSGEGLAHYLESLGKSRSQVDGMVVFDVTSPAGTEAAPAFIAPACSNSSSPDKREMAGYDTLSAALGGPPRSMDLVFDDPGISIVTQPFIRAFKMDCDPTAARALGAGIGVVQIGDESYSKHFISARATAAKRETLTRDTEAARVGDLALATLQGLDASVPASPQSDSWMVAGRTVVPGWLIFVAGLVALVPGLVVLRAQKMALGFRVAYSLIFGFVLYSEPEVAIFVGLLPSLFPPGASKKLLTLTFLPLAVLIFAGLFGLARNQVTGSWLSIWDWAGLILAFGLLYATPGGSKPGRRAPAKAKRSKR